jgi:hypothetical protein
MSLIDEICKTDYYDFNKLLKIVDFDDLGEYINIHDKCDINLLLWMHNTKYENSKINQYIDKYYKLFNYDKVYSKNKSLLMTICNYSYFSICTRSYDYKNISVYIINKINIIKEIIKIDYFNRNLLFYCHLYNNRELVYTIIKSTGILNRPFYNKTFNHIQLLIFDFTKDSSFYEIYNKYSENLINYFGILNKPSFVVTKYYPYIKIISKSNIMNNLILVHGRY